MGVKNRHTNGAQGVYVRKEIRRLAFEEGKGPDDLICVECPASLICEAYGFVPTGVTESLSRGKVRVLPTVWKCACGSRFSHITVYVGTVHLWTERLGAPCPGDPASNPIFAAGCHDCNLKAFPEPESTVTLLENLVEGSFKGSECDTLNLDSDEPPDVNFEDL
jgi:hypothetical protein